ncbi:3-hydroxyisobutyryl-CoA hydrolase-like protein 1, mitochondrial [Panicum miliaceum]|uniref:3-hydroxyisobutyryl-CoA hydrolase n=1 Tax=Panicum miliaceum TaxID=4540 RepID=A0A3L6R4L4_PANMI|nr:3-hydroxyisobutyryl-CoA hydrolase-like protein 1, mitochondrial [Panicum miliaceum]
MNSISNELPAQIVGNQNTDTRRDTPGLDRLPRRFHDPCIAVSMCHIITISRRMNNGKTTEIQHEEVHILRLEVIDKCFGHETVDEEIVDALESEAAKLNEEWCTLALKRLKEASPLALKVSLRSGLPHPDQCPLFDQEEEIVYPYHMCILDAILAQHTKASLSRGFVRVSWALNFMSYQQIC